MFPLLLRRVRVRSHSLFLATDASSVADGLRYGEDVHDEQGFLLYSTKANNPHASKRHFPEAVQDHRRTDS
jgi:hypothetical protein